MTMPKMEIHYNSGDWAALYIDGKLERVGDSYLAEQRALQILGVIIVQDDAFMRGQNQSAGVAQTLAEVTEYREQRDANVRRATELREQAKALEAEARRLDPEARGLQ